MVKQNAPCIVGTPFMVSESQMEMGGDGHHKWCPYNCFSTLCTILVLLLLSACSPAAVYTTSTSSTHQSGKTQYMNASWYGTPYHGRKTANGETYNMYDHTAAHKTLPFGTKLRLTNEANRKSVTVRINDRGPFVDNRDLDVSYKTAQDLGFVEQGICRLRVEFLK